MAEYWEDDPEEARNRVARIVAGLLALANDDEARRLLGVEGTLEDELDLTFLVDPLGWIANEVASAIQLQDDENQGVSLSSVVALIRLYGLLRGGPLDARELQDAVVEALADTEEDDESER